MTTTPPNHPPTRRRPATPRPGRPTALACTSAVLLPTSPMGRPAESNRRVTRHACPCPDASSAEIALSTFATDEGEQHGERVGARLLSEPFSSRPVGRQRCRGSSRKGVRPTAADTLASARERHRGYRSRRESARRSPWHRVPCCRGLSIPRYALGRHERPPLPDRRASDDAEGPFRKIGRARVRPWLDG
jgi:hypothetical protein